MIYYPGTDIFVTMPHFGIEDTDPKEWIWEIEGRANYFLQCETVPELAIEARIVGAPSYTNLETTPIALAPYIGIRQPFQFRMTSNSFSASDRLEFLIWAGVLV